MVSLRGLSLFLLAVGLLSAVTVWLLHLTLPERLEAAAEGVPVRIFEGILASAIYANLGLFLLMYFRRAHKQRLYLFLIQFTVFAIPVAYAGFGGLHLDVTPKQLTIQVSPDSKTFADALILFGYLAFLFFAAQKYTELPDGVTVT